MPAPNGGKRPPTLNAGGRRSIPLVGEALPVPRARVERPAPRVGGAIADTHKRAPKPSTGQQAISPIPPPPVSSRTIPNWGWRGTGGQDSGRSRGGFEAPADAGLTEPTEGAQDAGPVEDALERPRREVDAPRRPWWKPSLGLMVLLGSALVLALVLRAAVVQIYLIPSESMMDTLSVGSRIAVNRVPVVGKQVQRGDVVVFRDSEGWLQPTDEIESHWYDFLGELIGFNMPDGQQIVVKRVIGVGGDTVSCCDAEGRIMVNGEPIDEPYLAYGAVPSSKPFEVVVPEDKLWVMGDNRQNSADSNHHANQGDSPFIPMSSVIGKAHAVVWPLTEIQLLAQRTPFMYVPDTD